jgi:hypothetical protein
VTVNGDDFVRLTMDFFANNWPHRGVLIVARSLAPSDFAGVARALATFAEEHPDDVPDYALDYLTARHRRR